MDPNRNKPHLSHLPRSGDREEFWEKGVELKESWDEYVLKIDYTPKCCCWIVEFSDRGTELYVLSSLRAKWYEEMYPEEAEVSIMCWCEG